MGFRERQVSSRAQIAEGQRLARDFKPRKVPSEGDARLQVMDESVKRGISGEISMTLEDNFMINRFIEALGASRYKTYRIYRKQLPC